MSGEISSTSTVGLIGLGQMGGAMAARLRDQSYRVVGYDISESARSAAAKHGVEIAESIIDVGGKANTILMSLPSPVVVREAVLGTQGLLRGRPVECVIDLSTTGYDVSLEVGRALLAADIEFIDAPVSGGVAGARAGSLTIMASTQHDVLDRRQDLLRSLGKRVVHVGTSPGQGQVMKLVNNMISSVAMLATAEGMAVGVKAGLDPEVMLEILNTSTGRNSHTEDKFPKHVLPRTFDFGFSMGLLHKDVSLGLEMARGLGVPMIVTSNASQVWSLALAEGGRDQDMTEVVKYLERWADVEIRSDSSSQKEEA